MKHKNEIEKLEREMSRCMKKHDLLVNPVCYTGNCPICNRMNEIADEINILKGVKKKNDTLGRNTIF